MKCGCGLPGRYMHLVDGEEVYACNKYIRCLTYDEQREKLNQLVNEMLTYKNALEKIVRVNGMDYEYKAWAKEGLNLSNDEK